MYNVVRYKKRLSFIDKGAMNLKKVFFITSLLFISLYLIGCSKAEVQYDGSLLRIGVVGEIPDVKSEKVMFEKVSLDSLLQDVSSISSSFEAIMITPTMFEVASDDKYIDIYTSSKTPIIFFDSEKRNLPFTNERTTYDKARWDSLKNGSHTSIYLNNEEVNKEDAWYFYLKEDNNLDNLYKQIFEKIEEL